VGVTTAAVWSIVEGSRDRDDDEGNGQAHHEATGDFFCLSHSLRTREADQEAVDTQDK